MAPLSLIVSAFAPVPAMCGGRYAAAAVRWTRTPCWCWSTWAAAATGWAARRWRRSTASSATTRRTWTSPAQLKAFFETVQALNAAGQLLAYHDRSDGGLFVTLCEMMFACHVGRDGGHRCARRCATECWRRCSTKSWARCCRCAGAIWPRWRSAFEAAGLAARVSCPIGSVNRTGKLVVRARGESVYSESGVVLAARMGRKPPHRMQRLRDNPQCAQEEYDRLLDAADPGLHANADLRSCRGHCRAVHRPRCTPAVSRSCASRVSTARSRWPRRSTAPASRRSTCT